MTPQEFIQQYLCQRLPILPRVDLPLDDLCQVISAERRRHIILVLAEACFDLKANIETISIQRLAESVAAIEADTTPDSVSPNELQVVRISLYHHHLGVLEQKGLIEWPDGSDTIRPTQRLRPIGTLLSILQHSVVKAS